MPADSEPSRELVLPHTWRPYGARIAATVGGVGLVAVCLFAWIAFPPEIRAQFTVFQKLTMIFLFGLAFAAWFALVRSRVVAEDTRLLVVNGYRSHSYEWAEVVSISLVRGAPWATLDLADGTTISALAIQGSDGPRARNAVRQIRALIT
ncbi:conserved hypothetical protein [metagenome]|uniref:Low molecular weight protein antigen 6 PH domain-containing protein n=1 Tax=metagenome TaxID=256318 RepID=A0A2P2C0A5_9ZZZZ